MSWIVESYIIHSDTIRSEEDIDSDTFIDLMTVERTIKNLYEQELISEKEFEIITLRANGHTLKEIAKELKLNRSTIAIIFRSVCDKIAYILGGYFTDEGYIYYLANKYSLSDNEIRRISRYIKSRNKHQLLRTQYN